MTGARFSEFFEKATGFLPYDWQTHVAENGFPDVLAVPTGLGKTEGAVLAWAWQCRENKGEPHHLVYCLPVRTLVRQTVERLRVCFDKLGETIKVYQVMGGAVDDEWVRNLAEVWVIVGTQDQLLSRALNRGYAMSRFEWPVHFGLLNNDCRWIVDEVQLMGPGLWTTAQLDWMRRERFGTCLHCPTTWMSATIGAGPLETTDRKDDGLNAPSPLPADVIDRDRKPEIQRRRRATRAIKTWSLSGSPKTKRTKNGKGESGGADFHQALASAVSGRHVAGTLSLVVCNTVEAARCVYAKLPADAPKVLLTSRFRRQDREAHEKILLDFEAKRKQVEAERERQGRSHEVGKPLPEDQGLICVSTQVVEAGVDISAHHLWSEVAPWPSVIQRLGRLNRDGREQEARAWFWKAPSEGREGKRKRHTDRRAGKQEEVRPYEEEDIDRAWKLIVVIASPSGKKPFAEALEELKQTHSGDMDDALRPKPEPMPRAIDVHGLFSTERDVHGGFTDVSGFVRGIDPDADLTVVWRDWAGGAKKAPPKGDDLDGPPLNVAAEGCPVPFYRLRDALKGAKARGWLWNDEYDKWEEIRPDDLRPGMVVMLHRDVGGYDETLGWTGESSDKLDGVLPWAGGGSALRSEERTKIGCWVPLDVHLGDARGETERLCDALGITDPLRAAVVEAAGWHDLGKVHPKWQSSLPAGASAGAGPWAKSPQVLAIDVAAEADKQAIVRKVASYRRDALRLSQNHHPRNGKAVVRLRWAVDEWLRREELDDLRQLKGVRWAGHVLFRPGLRHEAASALAMWHGYRQGKGAYPALAVYLAAAHHGKVRTVFRSLTDRGDDAFGIPREPDALHLNGECWPLDFSVAKDGAEGTWTNEEFALANHGWTGLVADLLGPWRPGDKAEAGVVPHSEPRALGPFKLAYLEALLRIADRRASDQPSQCTKPSEVRRDD